MANIYRNINITGLSDVLGHRFVYCKTHSGKTLVTHKPLPEDNPNHRRTKQSRPTTMHEAAAYASLASTQDVYLNHELRTGVSAYYTAITDWFSGPRVLEINVDAWTGGTGQTIHVKARDNFKVTAVAVIIRDAAGNLIEMGEAVQSEDGSPWWSYTTRSHASMNPFPSVEAIAQDLPGNRDSFTIS